MSDYMDELNRLMERFAANPDVVATALTGRLGEVLILSGQCEGYTQDDEWSRGFELRLGTASRRGGLVERQSTLTNARITFLFGDPDWFFADPRLRKCRKWSASVFIRFMTHADSSMHY